jgi:hypothetical protein
MGEEFMTWGLGEEGHPPLSFSSFAFSRCCHDFTWVRVALLPSRTAVVLEQGSGGTAFVPVPVPGSLFFFFFKF